MVYTTMTTATDGEHAGDAYACEGSRFARPLCVLGGGGRHCPPGGRELFTTTGGEQAHKCGWVCNT